MTEPVIAVVFDFDGTLGTDTVSLLLTKCDLDPAVFWKQIDVMVNDGWDPPLAYMHQLLKLNAKGKIDLRLENLQKLGREMALFPGLPDAFFELKDFVKGSPELIGGDIKLEFYVISGGIEEMIRTNPVGKYMNGIFGCSVAYDRSTNDPVGIKTTVSFTEKTRYIYGISKGLSVQKIRERPYEINDSISQNLRRIPLSQMIYIGDGPSDIPCLSTIIQAGGMGIGVSGPSETFKKGYELARGKRITVGPYTANYNKGSDMRKVLEESILRIGLDIILNKQKHVIKAPEVG